MKSCLLVTVGLCLAPPAMAASGPPTTVLMGTAAFTDGVGTNGRGCTTNAGPAGFQRGAASATTPNPSAVISIPAAGVSVQFPPSGLSFTGVIFLKFNSATGGVASFDYNQSTINSILPSGRSTNFGGYSQVWTPDAGTLKVSFNLLFPDCSLPVLALFRTTP